MDSSFDPMVYFPVPNRAASAVLRSMQIHGDRVIDSSDEQRQLGRGARGDQAASAAILATHRDHLRRMVALRLDHGVHSGTFQEKGQPSPARTLDLSLPQSHNLRPLPGLRSRRGCSAERVAIHRSPRQGAEPRGIHRAWRCGQHGKPRLPPHDPRWNPPGRDRLTNTSMDRPGFRFSSIRTKNRI